MCPERWRTTPRWQTLVQLYNASKLSPLAGWPDRYLAWVTHGMALLEHEFAERQRRLLERK